MRSPSVLVLAAFLGGCVSTPVILPEPTARPTSAPPPMRPAPPEVSPSSGGFIAPTVMNLPGLEGVIGRNATALANIFGPPRLEVREGDAIKLQFSGDACVLDVVLYPLRPNGEPAATHVDARRSSDGRDVDRASCVRALRR